MVQDWSGLTSGSRRAASHECRALTRLRQALAPHQQPGQPRTNVAGGGTICVVVTVSRRRTVLHLPLCARKRPRTDHGCSWQSMLPAAGAFPGTTRLGTHERMCCRNMQRVTRATKQAAYLCRRPCCFTHCCQACCPLITSRNTRDSLMAFS